MDIQSELDKRLVDTLSASQRPLSTNEISRILGEPRHRILRTLSRLLHTKKIQGDQARARGGWLWWATTQITADVPNDRQAILEDVASRLREDFGFLVLDHRYGQIPVTLSDRVVMFDHLAYETKNGMKKPYLLAWVREGQLATTDLTIASGAIRLSGAKAFLHTDGVMSWQWFTLDKSGTRLRLSKKALPTPISQGLKSQIPFDNLGEIRRLVDRCHDLIRGEEGLDPAASFEELSKVLFAKLYDEKELLDLKKQQPEFIAEKTRTSTAQKAAAEKVERLYDRARLAFPDVFGSLSQDMSKLRLSHRTLYQLLLLLQGFSLSRTDIDVKGSAYELMVKDTFTGRGLGQFFTPFEVVEFMVEMVQPAPGDLIIDPACGSGGFLIQASRFVMKKRGREDAKRQLMESVYGIDISPRMAWVTKMNMVMHGDGQGHVSCQNALQHSVLLLHPSAKSERSSLAGFDVVMTNPPFGAKVTDPEVLAQFETGTNKRSRSVEALFVERCISLATPGGRIALIVPDGLLHNPSDADLRRIVLKETIVEAIVKLPEDTFVPFGSSANSSILFLRKKDATRKQGQVFMAIANSVGFDRNGVPTPTNDLITIGQLFLKFKGEEEKESEGSLISTSPLVFLTTPSAVAERMDPPALAPSEISIGSALRQSDDFVPLSHYVQLVNKSVDPMDCPSDVFTYAGLAQVGNFTGAYGFEKLKGSAIRSRCSCFEAGDILFGRLRPNLRKVAYTESIKEGICSTEFYVLRPKNKALGALLAALLRSDFCYQQISHLVTGIGRPRISKNAVMGIRLPSKPEDMAGLGGLALESQQRSSAMRSKAEHLLDEAERSLHQENSELLKLARSILTR